MRYPISFKVPIPTSNPGPIVPIELEKIYKHQFWGYTNGLVSLFGATLANLLVGATN